MRIQFTREETAIIENNRVNGIDIENSFIPSETEGRTITLGLTVIDPYKFNMFISKYFSDPEIKNQIGAELAQFDLGTPIDRTNLFALKDYIDQYLSTIKNDIDSVICGEQIYSSDESNIDNNETNS